MRPAPPLSDAAHRAVTAELVRLTFPHHDERPELLAPVPEGALVR